MSIEKKFKQILASEGIKELYPPQEKAVKAGLIDGRNFILSTPTASGKTLTAEIAMIKALEEGKRIVYIVPLRALAYEKFNEFQKYKNLGYIVRLEVGDMDSSKYRRALNFDILVATAEKCDSILRSRPQWFRNVRILVMDEIHLIASNRGPVYEILISKFRKLFPEVRVLGLSATIGNAEEISEWLDATLIQSDWRPVKLKQSVVVGDIEKIKEICKQRTKDGQLMIFVNSRRSAEHVAELIGRELNLTVQGLDKIADEVLNALSSPTDQCRREANCIRNGTAFHHAGLVNRQRTLIENGFKDGKISVIVATPTLAAGVNLPSRTVIIRDVKRYGLRGLDYIPVLEYHQQAGRAGRPKYDRMGEVITIAKSESEKDYIVERYVNGKPEGITSMLGVEPILRCHVLATIASEFARTDKALLDFFSSTFFGHQYGIEEQFSSLIEKITNELIRWKFMCREENFLTATPLGRRVSELYIDPYTAHKYLKYLTVAEKERKFKEITLLELLCDAVEMPLLRVKESEEEPLLTEISLLSKDILHPIPTAFDDFQSAYDLMEIDTDFVERYKTARMFNSWIEEETEQQIMENYRVAPGQLYQRKEIIQWLAYSASELSSVLWLRKSERELRNLETRLKHGVKKELLPLIGLRQIGRVRARKLFKAGYKTPKDLKKAKTPDIGKIIGKKTAESIKKELGQ